MELDDFLCEWQSDDFITTDEDYETLHYNYKYGNPLDDLLIFSKFVRNDD